MPFSWNFGPTKEMAIVLAKALAASGLDWERLRDVVDDIRNVAPRYTGPELPPDTDIWGIRRRSQSYGIGAYQEIATYPLAGVTDPAFLDDYPWPDPSAYDFTGFRDQVIAEISGPDGRASFRAAKLAISVCGNPFEIYCWMTGLEESLVNVLLNPDLVRSALDRISSYFASKMTQALATAGDLIDILYFADDLGGQRGLLLSRRAYIDVIQPYHARLFGLGKALAPHSAAMFHTDGAVFDVLPDLMDAGVDVLEAVQTDAAGMAPERLKAAYGDRLAFHGGIPVQSLLPNADAPAVYAECRKLVQVFGAGGGYVAAPTHAVQVGTPPQNVLAMLRAVLGEADYAAAVDAARRE
ncbi:MAG: hypothetical protein MUF84_03220 [Anaerolineae bacterium]|nr:hypothetical protein [Anaerolineae bacterium]